MNNEFGKSLTRRLIIKVVIPLVLSMFFLYFIFIPGDNIINSKNSTNYSFSVKNMNNITEVKLEEFKKNIKNKSDSIFFFCSNEDQNCYNMLINLSEYNKNIKYLNIIKITNIEKDELTNSEIFKDGLYPKLIIINNNSINYYSNYLNKEELNKIL